MIRRTLKMVVMTSAVVILSLRTAPVMAGDSFWDDLKATGKELYQDAKEKAPEVYDSAREKIGNAYGYAADKAPEVYEGVKEKACEAAEAVKAFRQDSEDEFREWLDEQIGVSNSVELTDGLEASCTETSSEHEESRASTVVVVEITTETTLGETPAKSTEKTIEEPTSATQGRHSERALLTMLTCMLAIMVVVGWALVDRHRRP